MKDLLVQAFPYFGNTLLAELASQAEIIHIQEAQTLDSELVEKHQVVLLEGCVKLLEKIRGQNQLLYRVRPGERLNLPVSIKDKDLSWVAELKSSMVVIPHSASKLWVCKFPSWRKFEELSQSQTVTKLLDTLWHTGDCLENRIIAYLKDLSKTQNSQTLQITHLEIAEEIGSVREVVSRSLKKLEQVGKLELKRGRIILES